MNSTGNFKNNFYFQILFIFFMGVVFTPIKSYAICVMNGFEKLELFVSPETGFAGKFSGKNDFSPSVVAKCNEDTNKYLMLTLGVARASKESNLKDIYIFNNYKPERCQIINSFSLAGVGHNRLQEHFNQQYQLLRSCVEIRVDDINGVPLNFKENQKYCQIKKTYDGGALLSGDMCFLKISSRSQFSVIPVVKNECKNAQYLEKLGIKAQDLEASLDVLVAGDDSGSSMDLTQIGARSLMLNVTPSSKVAPLSEDFGPGMPRFSTDYNVDVEWGRVAIRPTKSTTQINLSVLASNFSEEICESSDCYRSSNFIQPVFGQIEIYELNKNKKPTLIEEWWDGGFAAANWQGFISGFGYSTVGELFSLGKKYRIQMTFQNPADDFAIYLSGLNQILINLNAMNGGTIGIDSIPGLQNLKQIGIFPSYIGTSVLKNDDQSVNLSQIIKGLSEIISSRAWPPYTERVCNTSQNSCMKIGKTKYFHRLIMEFTAGEMNYETGLLDLNDVNLQKESKIFKGYGMQSRGFPEIYCEVTE